MKLLPLILWSALFALAVAGIMVYLAAHPSQSGLQESTPPHPGALATMFFYWWGGLMAAASPLIYLWLWRKARQFGRDGQEPY